MAAVVLPAIDVVSMSAAVSSAEASSAVDAADLVSVPRTDMFSRDVSVCYCLVVVVVAVLVVNVVMVVMVNVVCLLSSCRSSSSFR